MAGACNLAPDYKPPVVDAGNAFKETGPQESGPWQKAGVAVPATGKWWDLFGDAVLSGLEDRIEAGNPSLASAVARYTQATAIVTRDRANLLPTVDMAAQAGRSRVSARRPLSTGSAETYNNYIVGPSLSYELDLFGGVHNGVVAAEASADAAQSDVAAVRLGLQAQLASVYFDLRELDARTTLLTDTVTAYQRAFDLTSTRHDQGGASGIDVARSEAQLATAQAELDAVVALRAGDEHAIAILLGDVPAHFTLAASNDRLSPPQIPTAVPSTLLERRPDVAAAERRVAAANAQIGVARAAQYPNITLGLSGGYQSTYGNLFQTANNYWSLGPLSATMPLFDGGATEAGVRISKAQYDQAVADYRQTVLTAFREVEDDLATARQLVSQERNQTRAATAADHARDLALTRYQDGASDYLEVVTAQTAALDAERALLDVRSQRLRLATDTVRALGGLYQPTAAEVQGAVQ
ncbi:MAG: efflux transporter outer membrane subunit [Azospirillaceae bacterium]|nr:efflux transporter outer membrane subunit [Azospirillaceae bacterium]